MKNKKSKRLIVLIIVIVLTAASITAAIAVDYLAKEDNEMRTNSLAYIYDQNVYISEPADKSVEVPDDVYWEPMLGCYVSDELQYNPKNRKFEELLDPVDPILLGEDYREIDWWENDFDEKNEVHIAIKLMWDNWVSSERSEAIIDQVSFQTHIIPLGAKSIDGFLELAIDKNIFNKICLSAIGITGQINCTEWHTLGVDSVAMDDNKEHHKLWKVNFTELMADIKEGNINLGNTDKYGIFILPYLRDTYDENTELVTEIVQHRFNIESETALATTSNAQRFFKKNKDTIDMLEGVIEKYGIVD